MSETNEHTFTNGWIEWNDGITASGACYRELDDTVLADANIRACMRLISASGPLISPVRNVRSRLHLTGILVYRCRTSCSLHVHGLQKGKLHVCTPVISFGYSFKTLELVKDRVTFGASSDAQNEVC